MPPRPKFVRMDQKTATRLATRVAKESSKLSIRLFKASGGHVVLNLSDGSTVRDSSEWELHPRNETRKRKTEKGLLEEAAEALMQIDSAPTRIKKALGR